MEQPEPEPEPEPEAVTSISEPASKPMTWKEKQALRKKKPKPWESE